MIELPRRGGPSKLWPRWKTEGCPTGPLERMEDALRPALPGVGQASRNPESIEVQEGVRDLFVGGSGDLLILALKCQRGLVRR